MILRNRDELLYEWCVLCLGFIWYDMIRRAVLVLSLDNPNVRVWFKITFFIYHVMKLSNLIHLSYAVQTWGAEIRRTLYILNSKVILNHDWNKIKPISPAILGKF